MTFTPPGYPAAIAAGVQSVMVSYSSWQGVKMHGNASLLTDVLKGRMGFDGIVVSDWNAHGQVPGCTTFSCPASLIAGLDMFMAPDSWKQLYESTLAQARSGEVPAARLDDAVRRILRVKLRSGLFEAGRPSSRPLAGQFALLGAPAHRAVARRAVRESLVLLKNAGQVLPLKPRQRVLVAGDGADDIAKQSGGWTLSWQGTGTTRSQFPNAQSIYEGIREAVKAAGGVAELNRRGTYTTRPDVAIVVFGENPYAEFQGDLLDVEYSPGDKRDLALLKKLGGDGIPVIAVFISGRPLWVNPEINASNAFVAAWLPGSEGGGVADVLFRKPDGSVNHDFTGKLSFSWPRTPDQVSVNSGDGGDSPLFAYGYGLTYADSGDLAPLAEDVPRRAAASIDSRTFFAKGKLGRGWRLFVQEGTGPRIEPVARGEAPTAAVSKSSPRIAPRRRMRAQHAGTARRRRYSGIEGGAPIDLQRETNGELSLAFEYRVTGAPTADVLVSVECGIGCKGSIPIAHVLKSTPRGEWRNLKILLSCFQNAGADMKKVSAPFVLATAGQLGSEHHQRASGDRQGRRACLRTVGARSDDPRVKLVASSRRQISTYAPENHRRRCQGGRRRDQDRFPRPQRRAERQGRNSCTGARSRQGTQLSPESFGAQPRWQSFVPDRPRVRESQCELHRGRAARCDGALSRRAISAVRASMQRPRRRTGAGDHRPGGSDACRRHGRHAAAQRVGGPDRSARSTLAAICTHRPQ